ncbi:MAG TPA: CehA/McbA family metallohydrolase [Terriglobales bacterium]|nr:CehA/McbA family metallohydrolase [Terriglobales bacterium]
MFNVPTILLLIAAISSPVLAQRDPVLKQIDEPHAYYYREMYIPQLTTGPSSVAWSPDSRSVIYSMAGSLWRQKTDAAIAEQLTAGPGYDYQPDCSRDGRWVIYVSYQNDAIELWALDLETKQPKRLTSTGAVNLEPRFSPDGKRVAFVSTLFKGNFHIFAGDFASGELKNIQRLTGETQSELARYYYSRIDHEISPAWSPDGSEILFVSNRGHMYGTGGFWRMKAQPGAEAREIHYEETSWKARPDFSPDGKRIVYASYLGQQWHQLWVLPADGGNPFPISYGDFDNVGARWSPDGKRIAFISNRGGNTSLWIQEVLGGAQAQLAIKEKHYLHLMAHLAVSVLDGSGHQTSARVFVTGEDGRAYAPDDSWMRADGDFVRSERPFEPHYFHTFGPFEVVVPAGKITVEAMKGFEYRFAKQTARAAAGQRTNLTISLQPLNVPHDPRFRWVSGDVHVHMNYGGAYRNTPKHLLEEAAAENLSIVQDLIVNKEQRIPDISYFSTKPDPASTATTLLLHGQEFHTTYWGHLDLLNLTKNFLLPGYADYPQTAAASLFPPNAVVADVAHEQQALVGYAHPFDWLPDPAKEEPTLYDLPAYELPVDIALGKVDYIEALGFDDHMATTTVWYKLLNCGFHLPAAGGTDAMDNFASLRGPVGLNRVYAKIPAGPLDIHPWLNSVKQGQTFATNGPLLGFALGEHSIGETLRLPAGENKVKFNAWLRSFVPVDHLQIVCNGKVAQDLKLSNDNETADAEDEITISRSGWCLLRALSDKSEYPVLDLFPYATTSPIYVQVAGSNLESAEDAAYFVAWIDRLISSARENQNWNTEAEKKATLDLLSYARTIYAQMEK